MLDEAVSFVANSPRGRNRLIVCARAFYLYHVINLGYQIKRKI